MKEVKKRELVAEAINVAKRNLAGDAALNVSKFEAAAHSALQGHAKSLADLFEMLRDGYALTAEDDRLLDAVIQRLRVKPKGTPGRKNVPRPFGHTWNVRAATEEAWRLQYRLAAEGIDLTQEQAATVVCQPRLHPIPLKAEQIKEPLLADARIGKLVAEVLNEWRRHARRMRRTRSF